MILFYKNIVQIYTPYLKIMKKIQTDAPQSAEKNYHA